MPSVEQDGRERSAAVPKPALLITIDVEGDNLWAAPRRIETRNSRFLPRFQNLCEKYDLRPTYLVNWEMACCPVFGEFARDLVARGVGEIGMHLHAWNSPPIEPLTDDDHRWQPYLIEYGLPLMREKVKILSETLRQNFSTPVVSHRAGRWAFDERYAQLLIDQKYLVDCSMTPGVSWRTHRGAPQGVGGADYSSVPRHAFWVDIADVPRAGSSSLLEVPVTIHPGRGGFVPRYARYLLSSTALGRRAVESILPTVRWFRPNRRNRGAMLEIVATAARQGADYIEMMMHSSELMPAGSPYFPDQRAIEQLYIDLESVFSAGYDGYRGMTLSEYHAQFLRVNGGAGHPAPPPAPVT